MPFTRGMVLMAMSYNDGDEDPYVLHASDEPCTGGEQPHKMSECAMFALPREGFTP